MLIPIIFDYTISINSHTNTNNNGKIIVTVHRFRILNKPIGTKL